MRKSKDTEPDNGANLDPLAFTPEERAGAAATMRRVAAATAERRANLLAGLVHRPCQRCQADPPNMAIRGALSDGRVEATIACQDCGHTELRRATREGLDLWRIGHGVLFIVERGGGEQAVRLAAVDSVHLRRTETEDSIELVIHGGTWAGCVVADGPEMMAAIRETMEDE